MLITKKDKWVAGIIAFFIILSFLSLAWLSKSGGFSILADTLRNGL